MSKEVLLAAGAITAGLVGATFLFGSWYTVDQGERGVILRNGAVIGSAEPGLHFKTPLIEAVEKISTQSQVKVYNNDQGGLAAYSRDQQTAYIRLSVNYHVDPSRVTELYARYGSRENAEARLLDTQVYEEVKNVFGRFNAITAVQERARLNAEIEQAVRDAIGPDTPLVIESVQVENIDFSEAYEDAVDARMLAEVEVQKLRQNAEREKVQAEITVTQARAKADAIRAQAEAEAEAVRIKGEAEAEAIRAKGAALRDNPGLVALIQAERWNGTLPTTMVPGSAVPFLSMDK